MAEKNTVKAYRLFIFIDGEDERSKAPIMIIAQKDERLSTVKKEVEKRFGIDVNSQHWIIDGQYCYENTLDNICSTLPLFRKGILGVLYVMPEEKIKSLPSFIETYLEDLYKNVDLTKNWTEPEKKPLVITRTVDMEEMKKMGWNCEMCTFFNRPFMKLCTVCGFYRPENYKVPEEFCYTPEEMKYVNEEKEREKEQQRQVELAKKRAEKEKKENLERLKEMYKNEDVTVTKEITECPICCMDVEPGDAIILKACFHTVCKDCFNGYLKNADDPKVNCLVPDCQGVVEDREIKGILSEEDYLKYQQLNLRTAENKLGQAAFHCRTANCAFWILFDDNVNFFKCELCAKENCILCRAIHEGKDCKEYQTELEIMAKNDEAARKDKEFLDNMIKNGEAMKCPGCQIIVQKKQGCDWMQCNMCKMELCWATKGPRWGPKGKGDTSGGCRCRVDGKKCTPKCGNCH